MLGYLLARAGVPVVILEKHADFFRDFRGDTVHPSTLEILDELGLLAAFADLPQHRVDHLAALVGGRLQQVVDFRGLAPFGYLSLVPQWDFLDFIARQARLRFPRRFDLRMRHEVIGLVESDACVRGVRVRAPEGEYEIDARLVVGCDGRHSTLREATGLEVTDYGAPMDVLWFRVPRTDDDPDDTFGILGAGHMMVLLNRGDYWQAAYLVPKDSDAALRAGPIARLRDCVAALAPFLAGRADAPASWDEVKTLAVRVDRLQRWYRPGLLLIGDAAHAMSPIGGVGINLAIADAVASANALAAPLGNGIPIDVDLLRSVQDRRLPPARWIQALQLQIQKRVISRALEAKDGIEIPALLRWLLQFRIVRQVPARIIGYGFRREHVRTRAAGG